MIQNISNQTAVVTGAGGAFGREIVKQLLDKGFWVAASDISEQTLSVLAEDDINSEKLQTFVMDISDRKDVLSTAEEIAGSFDSPVSVLVNNAGIFRNNPIFMPDSSDIAGEILKVNLLGVFNCVPAFAKLMVKNKFGRIINIASTAGVMGAGGASAYAASKAGLIGATKSWARELGVLGITVNAVAPGVCETPMMKKEADSRTEKLLLPLIPLRRLGTPFDVAEAVCFLASSKTNYINGQVVALDGGLYTGTIDEDAVVSQ